MNTCILCVIALVCLLSSLLVSIGTSLPSKSKVLQSFEDTLTPEQRVSYKEVVSHRRNLYMKGSFFGLVSAALLLGVLAYKHQIRTSTDYICTGVPVWFAVLMLYYTLSKKPLYMVSILSNKEQIDAWLSVYRYMQLITAGSFALALAAVVTCCLIMCHSLSPSSP